MTGHMFSYAAFEQRLEFARMLRLFCRSCTMFSSPKVSVKSRMDAAHVVVLINERPCLYWFIEGGHCALFDMRYGMMRLAKAQNLQEIEDETRCAIAIIGNSEHDVVMWVASRGDCRKGWAPKGMRTFKSAALVEA